MTDRAVTYFVCEKDKERFREACRRQAVTEPNRDSIGTLGEKTLHAVLKYYYEPDTDCHEVPMEGYVADIVGERGITEIQTRGFVRLRPKLEVFLEAVPVTVVYPVICHKTIVNTDVGTGEVLSVRRSPKKENIYVAVRELYTIRDFLNHPRLTIRLVLLDTEEVRRFGVRTRRRKKQRTRRGEYVSDLVPVELLDEITLAEPKDYDLFLPTRLRDGEMPFGTAELAAAAAVATDCARMTLNLLTGMGRLIPAGKRGNARLYWRQERGKPKE